MFACVFVCECVGVQGLLEKYAGSSVFTNASSALRSIWKALGDELDLCEQFLIITYVLKMLFFSTIVPLWMSSVLPFHLPDSDENLKCHMDR